MDITDFVSRSLGVWRSQRSVHHLAFAHFEQVNSVIEILPLETTDIEVMRLCQEHNIEPEKACSPFKMKWEGESDWDEQQELKGSTILVPIPESDKRGKLLRDKGYAETVTAVAEYQLMEDETFFLSTVYDRAAAEERIWFVNPNFRLRVSLIKTSSNQGVVTASFSSEIRKLS